MTNNIIRRVAVSLQNWYRGRSCSVLRQLDHRTLQIDDSLFIKLRLGVNSVLRDMDPSEGWDVSPPKKVKGMTSLQRDEFKKTVRIPGMKVPKKTMSDCQKVWKPLLLKLRGLKPIVSLAESDPLNLSHSLILLDPDKIRPDKLTLPQKEILVKFCENIEKPEHFEVELKYDNWSAAEIIRAVLPLDADNVTSFTQIGHIAHLNLKPENLPFKTIIGEVILDKVPSVKTVVNKLSSIDNTYRNFSMELLAGEENYVTQTRENNCVFEMDFSKVYWNSRLGTEHQRVVTSTEKSSLVYDIFAGIGPFAIPLAKQRHCSVLANDLNPASYESLLRNIKLNSIKKGHIDPYNLDGREFILTVMKESLIKRLERLHQLENIKDPTNEEIKTATQENILDNNENDSVNREDKHNEVKSFSESPLSVEEQAPISEKTENLIHQKSYAIMNLPASAIEFLDAFNSLLCDISEPLKDPQLLQLVLPHVFCYSFSPKAEMNAELRTRVEAALGVPLVGELNTRIVRNVAPNKEMVCISFKLWPELVLGVSQNTRNADVVTDGSEKHTSEETEPDCKKQKLES